MHSFFPREAAIGVVAPFCLLVQERPRRPRKCFRSDCVRSFMPLPARMDRPSSPGESMDYARITLPAPPSRGSRRSCTCVTAMCEEQCSDWRRTAASMLNISAATAPDEISEIRRAQVLPSLLHPQLTQEGPAYQPDEQLCLLIAELDSARNACPHGSKCIFADQIFYVTPAVSGRHILAFVTDGVSDGFEGGRILSRHRACENACAQWPRGKIGQGRQQGW